MKGKDLFKEGPDKTKFECMECGHKFKKKLGKNTVEVKCPKCGGYDTDLAEALEMMGEGFADTILKQIKALDRWALGAWAAREFVKDEKKKELWFRVKGSKIMAGGKILIRLTPMDLYDVELWRLRKGTAKKVKEVKGIYFDMLVKTIDGLVG